MKNKEGKEFSQKDLLECFDGMCQFLAIHGFTKKDERAVAIRQLIQNPKPEVDEKEIWGLVDKIKGDQLSESLLCWELEEFLTKAGVKIVNRKEETK